MTLFFTFINIALHKQFSGYKNLLFSTFYLFLVYFSINQNTEINIGALQRYINATV